MRDAVTCWDSEAPATDAQVEEIEHFDARGMHRVYGRGDQFGRHHKFNMDIWRTRDGRLLMRCWSRCEDIDWRSFEIRDMDIVGIPQSGNTFGFEDSWIPRAVRGAYDEWIQNEW